MNLTPKQEAFAQNIASGMTQADAYYVYQLVDPRDGSIFYIGKGKGDRIKSHVKAAKNDRISNAAKHVRITSIMADGLQVVEQKTHTGLSEREALMVERSLIKSMKESLTNIANGVSVTTEEKIRLQGAAMLKGFPPFEMWLKYGRVEMLEVYRKLYGSERAYYDWLLSAITGLSDNGC